MNPITIALDAMGGDHGAQVVVPAALDYIKNNPQHQLILVGQTEAIQRHLPTALPTNLSIQAASQVVGMDEPPANALRKKKDSSMRVALNLVKAGQADACVSAGNTGALMATARFVLKMLPNVDRPAIITALPTIDDGHTWVLDLGANVDCSAHHLFQFAVMGAELVRVLDGIDQPKVGLLNIGQEDIKGNEQVKQADELLKHSDLNYIGYVEGDDIYLNREVNIIVTDGFVGNIALKTSEGVAKMIRANLKQEFNRNLFTRFAALLALPVLKNLSRRIDPRRYNGASLLGLKGVVVKSHGSADALAYRHAIEIAVKTVQADIAARIEHGVSQHLESS